MTITNTLVWKKPYKTEALYNVEEWMTLTGNTAFPPNTVNHPGEGVSIVDGYLDGEEWHTPLRVDHCDHDPGLRGRREQTLRGRRTDYWPYELSSCHQSGYKLG